MYVRILKTNGGTASYDVPYRSGDTPVAEMIRADHVPEFEIGDRVYTDEIEDLDAATAGGGDTHERLRDAAEMYIQNHPSDYSDFASVIEIRWAKRVEPETQVDGIKLVLEGIPAGLEQRGLVLSQGGFTFGRVKVLGGAVYPEEGITVSVVPESGGDARLSLDYAATFETGEAELLMPGDETMPGESQRFLVAAGQTEGWVTLRATYGEHVSDFRVFVSSVVVRMEPPVILLSTEDYDAGPTDVTFTIEGEAEFTGGAAFNGLIDGGTDINAQITSISEDRRAMTACITPSSSAWISLLTVSVETRQRSGGRQVKTHACVRTDERSPALVLLKPEHTTSPELFPDVPKFIQVSTTRRRTITCKWQGPQSITAPGSVVAAVSSPTNGGTVRVSLPTGGTATVVPGGSRNVVLATPVTNPVPQTEPPPPGARQPTGPLTVINFAFGNATLSHSSNEWIQGAAKGLINITFTAKGNALGGGRTIGRTASRRTQVVDWTLIRGGSVPPAGTIAATKQYDPDGRFGGPAGWYWPTRPVGNPALRYGYRRLIGYQVLDTATRQPVAGVSFTENFVLISGTPVGLSGGGNANPIGQILDRLAIERSVPVPTGFSSVQNQEIFIEGNLLRRNRLNFTSNNVTATRLP